MATIALRSNKEVMHKAGWILDENDEGNYLLKKTFQYKFLNFDLISTFKFKLLMID